MKGKSITLILVLLVAMAGLANGQSKVIIVSDDEGMQADYVELVKEVYGSDTVVENLSKKYRTLDATKIANLNSADLVVVARKNDSGSYDDGTEPADWNSITAPMLNHNGYLIRSSRWKWQNSSSAQSKSSITHITVQDASDPVFAGFNVAVSDTVPYYSSGKTLHTTGTSNTGNGTKVGTPGRADYESSMSVIIRWDTGEEYYTGAGQTAGGPRLFFATNENAPVQDIAPEGEVMLANAMMSLYMNAYAAERNPAPSAGAGADQFFLDPTLPLAVSLEGSAADRDPFNGENSSPGLTLSWSQVSGPVDAVIDTPDADNTNVTIEVGGEYVFQLEVSDNDPRGGEYVGIATDTVALYVNPKTTNLMAHWDFENVDAGNVNSPVIDIAMANDGVWFSDDPNELTRPTDTPDLIQDDPDVAGGIGSQALDLSGMGHVEVEIGESADPNFHSAPRYAITVAAWVKVPDIDMSSWSTVISKGDNSWRLSENGRGSGNPNGMFFGISNLVPGEGMPGSGQSGNIAVTDGYWHHVAGTYDGETLAMYIDGVLDVAGSYTGIIPLSSHPVMIGVNAQNLTRVWDGAVDDVRVYDYAMTQEEIVSELVSQGTAVPFVDAGADTNAWTGRWTLLEGRLVDDGKPGAAVLEWSLVSYTGDGAGDVSFADNQAATLAVFTEPGTYVIQLSADDGLAVKTDEVTVTVVTPTCDNVIADGMIMAADLNKDCYVDIEDVVMFVTEWLNCQDPSKYECDYPY